MNPERQTYQSKPKPLPVPPKWLLEAYDRAQRAWFKARAQMEAWEADNLPSEGLS